MYRNFQFSIGEFYHVYNRGADKRVIFLDDDDKRRFAKLLFLCNSNNSVVFKEIPIENVFRVNRKSRLIDIGSYTLMPNHFHLLVREKVEDGTSKFMKKLSTAYAMYFNLKNKRTGSLFEGPFKAQYVDGDQYLEYLYSYIHLNPVKIIEPKWKEQGIKNVKRAKRYVQEYPYSSYADLIGREREESVILNTEAFPRYFSKPKDFESLVRQFLQYEDK
ncbi:MAG: hypothetical protein A3C80_00310 [Candidatus Ryanbacteria bacterium RIFCSPHIGHO2_02_FULL_45_43]|uniref:Transposase IS200-like domain-containing protein n=1 Tax=Candidatus Ryanbacteria bacterium RIFCSPHIGHO2_01_45_13 TaxID=1802112 RepID=A0A1G2FYE4_9BACT|nr:MAG: hypothetical protein A2718_01700 [Candidatus Ryanbacteria bacterium RIFCSPHIGHO2_01_FULL_44_130]OGZ42752.1 MAG: hypothetical protein A2W41_03365 [Candidatus Ryanbacteria bacterium RIFCSPHIGHO2_01_45_13]OGZ48760.1 MAG: hypothetical protein A3C80_00310 [Candidatus Ryanbacteria bacterium RIFCSPHIGHO2_02_FULL_45_43]OGZ50792.1 MAG: hypothetical protein A3E55_02330 [Candidatus Ryanbacteria bacterium RIFCSPHIGHO2_12_FULL_44_20]OGZ52003.1 MAG: hypothetical protein A3A17_00915 [Candidatus Ryanba